ncbi:MAG: D-alanyl-D-alanine carboxypeptidase [Ruminococcaceae bacterium]|nr:D-alanyl-D-alanine carboxypeptidase [Oscillospiraceae bacterium]
MKIRLIAFTLVLMIMLGTINCSFALSIKDTSLDINVKSAVLMDANTGTVLYSKNMDESLPPASVTKIMTLLLVFEAIEKQALKFSDVLTVSENASSMGGSQVFLEPGETMSVDELIKCVAVASANDAALTLAEHVGGSEEAFVDLMNKKAQDLGMKNTHFENVTGLDDDVSNHVTSAYDIALMSRELLKHEKITEYTTIWMDTIRNGEFGLSNTNRLVKFYKGITGLKTGYTKTAGFCVSASAKRNDLHLIAVVMGAPTSNDRNAAACKLLDYGFANYSIYEDEKQECGKIKLIKGERDNVLIGYNKFCLLENLGNERLIKKEIILNENISAPINEGDVVGKIEYKIDGKIVGENQIISLESVKSITFIEYLEKLVKKFFLI